MANSSYIDTVYIMDLIYRMSPVSVLDVGAGFGRWGFLCRCHIGVGESLQLCPDQPLRIDAVEAFRPNVSSIYPAVFNNTYIGDARQVVPTLGNYDVIVCSHMIEHMPKEDGWTLIEAMLARSNKALIMALPFNEPLRGALRGNEFEAHHSVWTKKDFRGRKVTVKTFPFEGNVKLAVAVFPRCPEAEWAVKMVGSPLRRWVSRLAAEGRKTDVGDRRSEVRGRRSEVRGRRSEVGGQKEEDRDADQLR